MATALPPSSQIHGYDGDSRFQRHTPERLFGLQLRFALRALHGLSLAGVKLFGEQLRFALRAFRGA